MKSGSHDPRLEGRAPEPDVSERAALMKAERELSAARATLAEHVEENLSLHAECNELGAKLAAAAQLIDAMEKAGVAQQTELAALRARVARAIGCASHVGYDATRALGLALEALRG